MEVKTIMKKEVQTVSPSDKITHAVTLMSKYQLHRLPVLVDDKLVGLITEKTIASNSPSNVSSLSIHEMNYLLSKVTVEDVMIKEVVTVRPNQLVEDAAHKMRECNIGCLPVVDKNNKLKGIITTNDVLDSFMDLLGYFSGKCHIEIEVEKDQIGILKEISEVFIKHKVNIIRFSVYQSNNSLMIIVISDTDIDDSLIADLNKQGYPVKDKVELKHKS